MMQFLLYVDTVYASMLAEDHSPHLFMRGDGTGVAARAAAAIHAFYLHVSA